MTEAKSLIPWVRFVLFFVAANALLGAASLLLFPEQSDTLFFWTIKPAVNARLFGALYLGGACAVGWVALGGRWEPGRVLVPILVSAGALITTTTILHADRFTPGIRFAYWLLIYVGAPLLALAAYRAQERRSPDRWTAEPLRPAVRRVAVTLGAVLVVAGLVTLAAPTILVPRWPWPTSPLMVRIFASWFAAFGVGLLWFQIEPDWRRLKLVAILMVAAGCADLVVLLAHLSDIQDRGPRLAVYAAHLAAFAAVGAWMLAAQRRPRVPRGVER